MHLGVGDQDPQTSAAFQETSIQRHEGVDRVRVQVINPAEVDDDSSRPFFHKPQVLLSETTCVEDLFAFEMDGENFEDTNCASFESHLFVLCARRGSNPQPSASEADALSNCATSAREGQR